MLAVLGERKANGGAYDRRQVTLWSEAPSGERDEVSAADVSGAFARLGDGDSARAVAAGLSRPSLRARAAALQARALLGSRPEEDVWQWMTALEDPQSEVEACLAAAEVLLRTKR